VIGIKSVAALGLGAILVGIGVARHAFDPTSLGHLSAGACFLAALMTGLSVALVGNGWQFGVRSKTAVTLVRGRPAIVSHARPRELPGLVQRLVLLAGFAGVVLATLGNHASARIAQIPDEWSEPSPSEYCMPEPAEAPAAEPVAPPPPVEQPGCALVKRAFELGYAKTLGDCAPKQAAPVAVSPVTKREVCTRRQLDEPFLHYGFRRVAEAFSAATTDPVDAARHRVTEVRTHIDFTPGLLADIRHAITGSPHASHHVWITLPDPHPGSPRDWFLGEERCSERFADLPLWPAWRPGDEALLVEHVLGQLVFATRFGTTASCSDYMIHWDAAPDTCSRLATDPVAVLDRDGGLAELRAVLDRRLRQLELGALAQALGRQPRVTPPAASAIASVSCFVVDPQGSGAATGSTIAIDGESIGLREIRVPAVRTGGDGPIDVYAALAAMLGGRDSGVDPAGRTAEPVEPSGEDFLLARLDPLIDGDPFRGARAPLHRPELVEVYPFEHHLHGFIEAFRRRYLAQRGRL
jgi:hypothetical protein